MSSQGRKWVKYLYIIYTDSKLLYESCVSPWDELDPIGQFVESS